MKSCFAFVLVVVMCVSQAVAEPSRKAAIPFGHKLILTDPDGGSDSSVSPDGKWLAFASRRSGNFDVWLANIKTGKLRQITKHPATDNEPRWHPDGTHLVFVTQRSGTQDVYVVELATGKQIPIATKPVNEDYPSFSRDGSEVCFTGGPQGSREVQIYNFKTGKTRTLTRGFGYIGATNFSPDSKRLVFHAYYDNSYGSGKSDLFVVPTSGGKPVNITNEPTTWDYKPNWSFDGKWLTFSSKRASPNFNLWLVRPDGSERHALTTVSGPDLRWSNWTRDGRIGWHQIDRQRGKLRAVNIETGKVRDVFHSDFHIRDLSSSRDGAMMLFETGGNVSVVATTENAEPRVLASGISPRWRPDGKAVAYLQKRGSRIGIVGLDGQSSTLDIAPKQWLQAIENPWSPDGMQLAIATLKNGDNELWQTSIDGGKKKLLTKSSDSIFAPTWSKDGTHIFFAENHPRSVSYYISTESLTSRAETLKKAGQANSTNDRSIEKKFVRAADFNLSDLQGDHRQLSSLRGNVTVLYFWSLLRECESDLKVLQSIHRRYQNKGVSVVGLAHSSGSRESLQTLVDSLGVTFPTLTCGQDVCRQYNVATFPTTFLLDNQGRVRYWMYGILSTDHWEQQIASLLVDPSK